MTIKSRGFSPGSGNISLAIGLLVLAGSGCAQTGPVQTNTAPVPAPAPTEAEVPLLAPLSPADAAVPATSPPPPTQTPASNVTAGSPIIPVPPTVSATNAVVDTNVIFAPVLPAQLNLSPALAEVVKLIQAGVNPEVVLAYVTNSTELFNIGSEEILYLHDLGTPTYLITALIQKDSSPEAQARRKSVTATQPLPAGVALNTPATNVYPPTAAATVTEPPEPTPVAPPVSVETPAPATMEVAAQQPVSAAYFESELAPYGSWVYVSGYGRCWRPTVAVWNTGWRPYMDGGRWLWTDSGWYWYSDYSWGWAPYHYGRWFCPPGHGWVWMPDVHWGPAWVSWRYSGSYCGWAPLPPSAHYVSGHGFYYNSVSVGIGFEFGLTASDYVFLPYNRFCDRRPHAYYVHGHHAHGIYRDSKVANNYVIQNNRVINHGAGADRVPAIARGDVKRVALRGTSEYRDLSGRRRETLAPDGQTLTVVRPTRVAVEGAPPASGSTARPRVSRGDASQSFSSGRPAPSGTVGTIPSDGGSRPASQSASRPRETPSRIEGPSVNRPNYGRDQGQSSGGKSSRVAEAEKSAPAASESPVGRYSAPQRRSESAGGSVSGRRDPIIITGGKGSEGAAAPLRQPSGTAGSSGFSAPSRQPSASASASSRPYQGTVATPSRAPVVSSPAIQQPRREPVRIAPPANPAPSVGRPSFSAPVQSVPSRPAPSYAPPARIEAPRPSPAPAPSAPSVRSAPSRSEAPARSSAPANRGGGEGRGGGSGGGGSHGQGGGRNR